jgi:hypothetical protein
VREEARGDVDGTQAPAPPTAFGDPLSGLVTGDDVKPGPDAHGRPDEFRVAEPVEPDPEVVRSMVNAALVREGAIDGTDAEADTDTDGAGVLVPAVPAMSDQVGMIPEQRRSWSGHAGRMRQVLRPRPRRQRVRRVRRVRRGSFSSGSTAFLLALVLLVLFIALGVQLVLSVIDGVSGLFD